MWPITLSGRLPIVALVGRYLTNWLMGRELISYRIPPLTPLPCGIVVLCGISSRFRLLSPCTRQIAHALLTHPPLSRFVASYSTTPLDLHVLGTPPAFVLSQDQTLQLKFKTFIGFVCLLISYALLSALRCSSELTSIPILFPDIFPRQPRRITPTFSF